jgi:predicted alpha/beta superfamily hydrolase
VGTRSPNPRVALLDQKPSQALLRTALKVEPARKMRVPGFDWEHEIRVALPRSYGESDRTYPVLWLTDNALELASVLLGSRELILVAVGSEGVPTRENQRRRTYDFGAWDELFVRGPGGDHLRKEWAEIFPESIDANATGGAQRFLDFLIDDVRPALAADYRMDAEDHALAGMSGGGMFVGFAIFGRPAGFKRYICGSPSLYGGDYKLFELEEQYAATNDDLPVDIFFGAGEAEITEPVISAWGCVSSMATLAETLSFRGYPSLRLSAKIFAGETHGTVWPSILGWGVRWLWGDSITRSILSSRDASSPQDPPSSESASAADRRSTGNGR